MLQDLLPTSVSYKFFKFYNFSKVFQFCYKSFIILRKNINNKKNLYILAYDKFLDIFLKKLNNYNFFFELEFPI